MKKIISILLICLVCAGTVSAQSATALTWSNGLALDTVDNTETHYAGFQAYSPVTGVSLVVKVLKISGTVGGTISWQGSNDGTVYATITTSTASDGSANYSYAVSDGAPYKYYRVSWTGTGTMSASVSGTYFRRR